MRMLLFATVLSCAAALSVWSGAGAAEKVLTLASKAFAPRGTIPVRHTCDGEDLSPELQWSGTPAGTRSFVLLCDDPDAPSGLWVHWVVYNLPPDVAGLKEGSGRRAPLPQGTLEGKNGWGTNGYRGPCPPPGKPHRYIFRLFALDAPLSLLAGATRGQVEAAMAGHILCEAEYAGTYQR